MRHILLAVACGDSLLGKQPNDWGYHDLGETGGGQGNFPPHDRYGNPAWNGGRSLVNREILDDGSGSLASHTDYAFEVTTYRVDGVYTDHRRPESVCFTASLEEDLKRRDFTIKQWHITRSRV